MIVRKPITNSPIAKPLTTPCIDTKPILKEGRTLIMNNVSTNMRKNTHMRINPIDRFISSPSQKLLDL
jgi:hypothetical protein